MDMLSEPNEQAQIASIGRLRESGPELSTALLSGPDELRRRILTRLVKSVTYLKETPGHRGGPVLPHPDVPLRLAASDDLAVPRAPEGNVLDRQCPGLEPVYLGRAFEPPELVFVRSLDVEA
jgi:hypothetical protein